MNNFTAYKYVNNGQLLFTAINETYYLFKNQQTAYNTIPQSPMDLAIWEKIKKFRLGCLTTISLFVVINKPEKKFIDMTYMWNEDNDTPLQWIHEPSIRVWQQVFVKFLDKK